MIPLDLAGARQAVIDRLNAAGIVATGDPSAIPPVVLVAAPSILAAVIGGPTVDVQFPIVAIHPPPGNAAALDWLLTAASAVIDELAPVAVSAGPGTYGDPPAPAYTVTVTGSVPLC
jgi:hypothetical protein